MFKKQKARVEKGLRGDFRNTEVEGRDDSSGNIQTCRLPSNSPDATAERHRAVAEPPPSTQLNELTYFQHVA